MISREEKQRRARSLRKHVIVAMLILLVIIPVNFVVSPRYPWWMWALVVWLPLLALHTAWARGLIGRNTEGS